MESIAIVVVGYNRISGMLRLLDSLNNAFYQEDSVDLIISLDHSGVAEIVDEAEKYNWNHGKKRVRTFDERQGLRKHILKCGDYLEEYDAIAVFEDDIVVSPAFYEYAKQAVEFYKNNDDVAGISLYTHKINVNTNAPFTAEKTSYDVYFQQFAQSWGQIWMKRQWMDFKKWYMENGEKPIAADDVPTYVSNWPETSWLKYHIKYCIETNKYFVYPYHSLTTCFSDVGEHCKTENNIFQVPMMRSLGMKYRFGVEKKELAVYDAFFEREDLENYLEIPKGMLCTNIYGHKSVNSSQRYLLTRKEEPYGIVKSFGLTMRPHECNIICGIAGDDIFLYDITMPRKNNLRRNDNAYRFISYYYNISSSWRLLFGYIIEKIKRKFQRK